MMISKISDMSNKMHTMDIDVTDEQLQDWRDGTAIQDAMPNLTPDEREFIKTGITPKEWAFLGDDENDVYE